MRPGRTRQIRRHTPHIRKPAPPPMALEVIERHVFQITDPELADQVRQALAAHDIERLDELITALNVDGPHETGVLTVDEVKR